MSKVVIKAAGLGKEYLIGAYERRGQTFREMLMSTAAAPFQRLGRLSGRAPAEDRIWALKDVSFEVKEGEIVGVIGRNGAGKSTLLKILSRITTPTEGRAEIRGRVGSLLEVGTGFHPELTGRENVYLNGAILGMSRSEIRKKFDEIVDFAGVETFLDTPVKRYSSGMAVRLAFAVAAHLETEILLVDEVLAVGDADFQRKCLGKMSDVAHSGRTILFVSHNMAAVENLCSKSLLLSGGRLALEGGTAEVVAHYLGEGCAFDGEVDLSSRRTPISGRQPTILRFRIRDAEGSPAARIPLGGDLSFEIEGFAQDPLSDVTMNVRIDAVSGLRVAACHTYYQHKQPIALRDGFRMECQIKNCRLMPALYNLTLILKARGAVIDETGPITFEIVTRDLYGTGRVQPARTGTYIPEAEWRIVSDTPERDRTLDAPNASKLRVPQETA